MSEIPEAIANPPEKYDKIVNKDGKAGDEPNLYVDGRPVLRVTHAYELIADEPMSSHEYAHAFCNYRSFGGVVATGSRERYVEFLQATWQAIDFVSEYEDELADMGRLKA